MLAENEFEMNHHITYYECDPRSFLTVGMMINLAVLVSGVQADHLNAGTEAANRVGGGWVITSYEINVNSLPKMGDDVVLGTRATSYNKYFAYREFWISDHNGNEYAHINGIFVFMDLTSRKMVQIPDLMIEPYHSKSVKRMPKFGRAQELMDEDLTNQKNYRVRYFDIDANRHVNNSHYFDWMLDVLDAEFLKTHELKKMLIKYEREVRYGETVTSQAGIDQNTCADEIITKHQILVDDGINAIANCWWNESVS